MTMITPSYLGETIEYSSLHACRSTLEDPTYPIDLPAGTKSIRLPDNEKIRVLAISVTEANPEIKPAQPLYDLLARPTADSATLGRVQP